MKMPVIDFYSVNRKRNDNNWGHYGLLYNPEIYTEDEAKSIVDNLIYKMATEGMDVKLNTFENYTLYDKDKVTYIFTSKGINHFVNEE